MQAETDSTSLALFSRGAAMLAEANTIQKARELKDLALTAAEWARRKDMGEEAILHCKSYALEAERKMGEMLLVSRKATGAKGVGTIAVTYSDHNTPTLVDLGLTKRDSAEAQQLAAMPQETFDALKAGTKTRRAAEREMRRAKVSEDLPEFPPGTFRVFYADPPWKYGDELKLDAYGSTTYHYPTLSIPDLCALPVKDLTQPDAVLFLWVTSPLLFESQPIIQAWGFIYKASFVWDKIRHNWGHYNSVRHEFLLLCTRGSCLPDNAKLIDSVQSVERNENHSEKPEEFRQIINQLYPRGKRLELFARRRAEGWDAYGNQLG